MADTRDLAATTSWRPPDLLPPPAPSGQPSILAILWERWLSLTLVTVLAGGVGVGAIWWLVRPMYEVSAMVHVAPVVRAILFSDADTDITRNYRQYVLTEAADLVSASVIDAAIATPEVRSLSLLTASDEPVADIQKALTVLSVQGTELLKVSMTGGPPSEMATLVNAVLNTYLSRRETKQREWDDKILSSLKTEQSELETKMKVKTRQLRESNVEQGLGGAEDIGALLDRWMSSLQEQLTQANKDRALATARLAALDAEEGDGDEGLADPAGLEEFLSRDPELHGLKEQLRTVELSALGDVGAGRGPGHPDVQGRPGLIAALNERIDKRAAELHQSYVSSRRRSLQADVRNAEVTVRVLEQELGKLSDKRSGLAGQRFVLEELRQERDRIETSLNKVREKIWTVEVEQKRASRITVESRARVPEKPNLDKRLKYSAVALLMGFMLGAGVALPRSRLDTRFRDPEGVTQRLGVRVLGSVQYLANNHAPQNAFDDRLAEPIRGISTALLAGSAARGARTRLITSPTPGSGKSSLAMHLARGLAATGRRVLLVDADNHGQGITRRLQMTDQPGLADFLAGRLSADEIVYTGDLACLSVLPAGSRDERFGDILSGRDGQARLRSLFAGFDEVIVDSPPVLAKSDAVVLATLVDEVVLVLRAGRSTQEEARAAGQYLAAVGGNVVGVILNAVDPKHVRYGYSYSYSYAGSA